MKKISDEEDEFLNKFFIEVQDRIKDYKIIIMMATQWNSYDDNKQANLAIHYMGMYHASRFIIFMDYLALKYEKGDLK